MAPPTVDDVLERTFRAEVNRAVRRGALVASMLGLVASLGTAVLSLEKVHMRLPAGMSVVAGFLSFALWALAKRELIGTWQSRAVLLGLATLPSLFFAAAEALLPSGAATYIYGPITLLSLFIVVLSGFTFDPTLVRWVAVVSTTGHVAAWWLARPTLAAVPWGEQNLAEDMTSAPVAVVRAVMFLALGLAVAELAATAKRLVGRAVSEERERQAVARLFGEYVSDEVRDKVLNEGATLHGERRVVAVLFSDLRGFTTLSEHLEPAELVTRLNQYFDAMVEAIHRHGGTVDKFIGDAVMAVFGGVVALEQPCDQALAAARDMRTALEALNRTWAAQGLPALDNGVGLHFGPVLQGPIGSAHRKEFTVIGDVVNTASRLESVTKELGHAVVVSETLYEQLTPASRAGLVALGEVKLKGKDAAVPVYGLK